MKSYTKAQYMKQENLALLCWEFGDEAVQLVRAGVWALAQGPAFVWLKLISF